MRAALAALLFALPTHAETITFEASAAVEVIRCVDMFGTASCEFISSTDEMLQCVALDAAGDPLAVAAAFGRGPSVMFADLDAQRIARVVCEERR